MIRAIETSQREPARDVYSFRLKCGHRVVVPYQELVELERPPADRWGCPVCELPRGIEAVAGVDVRERMNAVGYAPESPGAIWEWWLCCHCATPLDSREAVWMPSAQLTYPPVLASDRCPDVVFFRSLLGALAVCPACALGKPLPRQWWRAFPGAGQQRVVT